MNLPETKDYFIETFEDTNIGRLSYSVVNKHTGVREFSHPAFPIVASRIHEIQHMFDNVQKEPEEESLESPSNTVDFSKYRFGKDD